MKKWLILFFLTTSIFASEDLSDTFDVQAAKEHIIDKRENFFLTSTDYSISPKVNPITGE